MSTKSALENAVAAGAARVAACEVVSVNGNPVAWCDTIGAAVMAGDECGHCAACVATHLGRVDAEIRNGVTAGCPRISATTFVLREVVRRGFAACGGNRPRPGTVAGWLRTLAGEASRVADTLDRAGL